MKKVFGWIWRVAEVLIIVYVIVITSFILSRNKYNYTQFGDYTLVNIDLLPYSLSIIIINPKLFKVSLRK